MKIAQNCPSCKEFFVTETRSDRCPFCEKVLPEKVVKTEGVKTKVDSEFTRDGIVQFMNSYGAYNSPKMSVLGKKVFERMNWLVTQLDTLRKAKQSVAKQPETLEKFTKEPSTDIIKEFVGVREQVQLLYNLVYGFLGKNTEFIKSKQLKSEELCDFGFICRELEHILDELRKEVKARKELCGQIIAFRKTQESIQDPSIKMKVQGQFATGTPDVKMQTELPKKFTDEYYKVTDHFGVPRNVAESGVLRLDWKAVTEHCTKLVQDGKRIPEGFGRKYPLYVTVYRKRKVK